MKLVLLIFICATVQILPTISRTSDDFGGNPFVQQQTTFTIGFAFMISFALQKKRVPHHAN